MKAASSAEPTLTALWAAEHGLSGGAEAAEEDVEDAAVHAFAHDVGQNGAGRADEGACDDEGEVADGEADAGGGPAGIRIQHRDDDGHVCPADGDDEQEADEEGQGRDGPEEDL